MTSKTFKITTLGCRTNQYESQAFQDQLAKVGYRQAADNEEADLCIVNTCTVTESADSSSRNAIRQLIKHNPKAKIAVTGCYAERNPAVISSIEGVDHVISNKDKEQLLSLIYPEESFPEFSIKRFDAHTRAFVKVQDGCNSFCTYCIIPYVRGRSRSKSMPDILNEVRDLVENGYKEIVLTGINIGDFDGNGQGTRLAELVKAVDEVNGVERVRVSSIDPDEVDDELLNVILNGKHTCKSMHIVLQSGSNVVLKRMNRKYTRQMFYETIDRIKSASSDFTFTTDIIVGFPGETEKDHEETLGVIKDVQFANVHMFPYSDRPRTRANLYPNKVSPQIIQQRKKEVIQASEKAAFELRGAYIGATMPVLTESSGSGHTDNFLQVHLTEKVRPNQILNVQLVENRPDGLLGKVIG